MQTKPLLQGREGPNPTEWSLIIDDQRFTPANRLILEGYGTFIADCIGSCCGWFNVKPSDWYGLIGIADRPYDRAQNGEEVISALPESATFADYATSLSEHLEVALHYVYAGLVALVEDNIPDAICFFSQAVAAHTTFKNFLAVIKAEMNEAQTSAVDMREVGKKGGAARAAKYKELEEKAVSMYEAGNFKSMRQAAKKITPKIFEEAKNRGVPLSDDNGERTVYDWIRNSK